jgi:hypothetical protein
MFTSRRTLLFTLVAIAPHAIAGQVDVPPGLASPAPPDAARVPLFFDAAVDLDLYVTGPAQETVYFANDTSRDGGALTADRRCDSPAPRVETVTFAPAPAGPYRIGVDFMVRCTPGIDRAGFELVWEIPGQAPVRQRGEARFGVFDPRVAEFHVGGPER